MKIFRCFLFDKDEFSTHRYVKQLKNGGVNFPGRKKHLRAEKEIVKV